jgi:hypothetical protein
VAISACGGLFRNSPVFALASVCPGKRGGERLRRAYFVISSRPVFG